LIPDLLSVNYASPTHGFIGGHDVFLETFLRLSELLPCKSFVLLGREILSPNDKYYISLSTNEFCSFPLQLFFNPLQSISFSGLFQYGRALSFNMFQHEGAFSLFQISVQMKIKDQERWWGVETTGDLGSFLILSLSSSLDPIHLICQFALSFYSSWSLKVWWGNIASNCRGLQLVWWGSLTVLMIEPEEQQNLVGCRNILVSG